MDEYIVSQLQDESLVMMVASTTGNGQAPTNGMVRKDRINPTKWTHFGVLSATMEVKFLHYFKNIFN